MKKVPLRSILISPSATVKQALARLEQAGEQILLVTGPGKVLVGTLTDGDIRRHILSDGGLGELVSRVCNHRPITLEKRYSLSEAKHLMLQHRVEQIPVVDARRRVIELLVWDDVLGNHQKGRMKALGVPVVIMAGGRGVRLEPFTRILPKPLIPVQDKPVIQVIMDRFLEFGCDRFVLTVNYKAQMIRSYFEGDEAGHRYRIEYLHERENTGTAGSLALLSRRLKGDFFVSNCDVMVKADYADLLSFHREHGNMITLVAAIQHFKVPFGVVELEKSGGLKKIVEKPEYDLLANTGFYVLNSGISRFFPGRRAFDMNELIMNVRAKGGKVGVFPVSPAQWSDVGQWIEYFRNAIGAQGSWAR